MSQAQPKKREWDVMLSFYKWDIFLSNGIGYPGYSKRLNEPEVHSKVKLLQRCLIRLKKEKNGKYQAEFGYFTPGYCDKIELYKRTEIGQFKEKICTLYPTFYELSNNELFNTNQTIISFLDMFYNRLKLGTIHQLDYSDIGYSKINEAEIFSMSAGRFKSIPDLQKYANAIMIEGFTYERVKHFIREYIDKNLSFS